MSLSHFRLDGKVALVTGSNRGIGLATAKLFAEAGASVLLTARHETDEVRALVASDPARFAWLAADVTDPTIGEKLTEATLDKFGRLDVLVNNAGVAANGNFHEFDDEQLEFIMGTNFTAPFRIARAAIKPMLAQGGGTVVNVGSISGYVANHPQLQVAYNSSKAAIHQMTKVMAFEYAARNIRVNAIAPGYVISDMTQGAIDKGEWSRIWADNTPMGRFGTTEEMANCALFLACPASSYVTGAILVADGGYLTR
ncbi:SDR family NAD(P)-dependent oxidoreductase [Falsirhodobacter xinxiangensis]|uniref:SDR family NAD(P)-dependent oxidoreductase n=1 Tax=Falsirhodobacter xinxiangensis TaxID=2530049 RepID=UPI0010AA24C2|nr:SDR family oxidoreductase [Rhodobacter xinxiangensis]